MVFCNKSKIPKKAILGGHNPYFNRWFSAILYSPIISSIAARHNPYFNRWFSAISSASSFDLPSFSHNPYLIDGFLQ